MKYSCVPCMYNTNNKFNYTRHMTSIKHRELMGPVNNQEPQTYVVSHDLRQNPLNDQPFIPKNIVEVIPVQEIIKQNNEIIIENIEAETRYVCKFCGRVMVNNHNVNRHLSRCKTKKEQDKEKEIEQKIKIEMQHKMEIDKVVMQRDKIQMEYECYKKITEKEKEFYELNAERDKERNAELRETIEYERVKEKSSNLSTSNYLMVNYNQAAPLLLLDNFSIFEEGDVELLELLLDAESNDEFYAFVGKALIKTYKTDDPKDQQLWNSDDDRLTYFIRRNFEWTIDKKGIKTGDLIVEPALKHFSNILKKFLNSDIPRGKHVSTDHVLADHKRRTLATKILIDVENGSIRHKVLKYIAPYLYLDKKIKCISPNEKNKLTFTEDEIYN